MSSHSIDDFHPLYGLMAEFETPGELVAAARRAHEAGFRKFDAYSPYPIHELDEAMDLHDNRVSLFTLIGGLIGCCDGIRSVQLGPGCGASPEYRRPSSDQRPDVYSDHIRVNGSFRRTHRRHQHDHA